MPAKDENMAGKKSVVLAYILWLFGGIIGLHHFYLRRDKHAFVWWSTLGGFGVGWLGEILKIPRFVRDANNDPKHMAELAALMYRNKKPPFSTNRFTGMLMVGYTWGHLMSLAVPPDEIWGWNFRYLNYLIPLVVALGVWTVGNIGREQGRFLWPLVGAYASYPLRYYVFDESLWLTCIVVVSALFFDSLSKQWKRTPRKRHGFIRRVAVISVCMMLYMGLWGSYVCFQGTITDSEGDEIPIYQALQYFFTSPWWLEIKNSLYEIYQCAQVHGWYEVWKQVVELLDPHGEQNAYRVLGVSPEATQSEITSTWRKLSRDHHPDKVKDGGDKQAAQERFMEIQQAYEILSKRKHRRNRKNKQDNSYSQSSYSQRDTGEL